MTPLRPQVTRMIGKYAKEKEDMLSLRQVLVNAEHSYNQLMDRAANAHVSPPVPGPALYAGMPNANTVPVMPPQGQSYQSHEYVPYPSNLPMQHSANSGNDTSQYGYDLGYSVVSQPPPGYE